MFQELCRHCFRVDPAGHEMVPAVTQHANQFSCQRGIQESAYDLRVKAIRGGDRTFFDMLTRVLTNLLDMAWLLLNCAFCFVVHMLEKARNPISRDFSNRRECKLCKFAHCEGTGVVPGIGGALCPRPLGPWRGFTDSFS